MTSASSTRAATTQTRSKRRWIVPEVIQSSAMDCGPASLKALLEGFGTRVSYGRLREACQTDVDGTSIDSLEEVAKQLGLDAEQIMIPLDHLLVPSAAALPAIVVVRLPNGNTHFVVVWGHIGGASGRSGWVQIMDPGTGRVWQGGRGFLDRCFLHEHKVPAAAWRQWASTDEFLSPLRERLRGLGIAKAQVDELLEAALADSDWRPLACLDAAVRLCRALLDAGGAQKGDCARLLPELMEQARWDGEAIPRPYWSVVPVEEAEPSGDGEASEASVLLRGVVLVRVRGAKDILKASSSTGELVTESQPDAPPLSRELIAALEEGSPSPWKSLLKFLKEDGLGLPALLFFSTLVAAGGVMLEALVFRAIFELGPLLGSPPERWKAVAMWLGLGAVLWLLRLPTLQGIYRLGRHLEVRLRIRFLDKITRLPNQYFASRLISDMAERSHSVHRLRQVPMVAERLCRGGAQLLFTTLGIVWLDPTVWPVALAAATAAVTVPLMMYPFLAERDLKARSHAGALSRFYLDGLLGLTVIRAHAAERSVRREHEALLKEWRTASESVLSLSVFGQGLQLSVGFGLAAWLLVSHLEGSGLGGGALLLVYWALRLPDLGTEIFNAIQVLPGLRSTLLRWIEPLEAPEDVVPEDAGRKQVTPSELVGAEAQGAKHGESVRGVSVQLSDVAVVAGGHSILHGVSVELEAGEHVAVVGPSGAGKSTLVGLLLGWHQPAAGFLRVDGRPLDAAAQERLRRRTAWVDPAVQLWNRSLFENLRYGIEPHRAVAATRTLTRADLDTVIERLPEGLSTPLGEGGGLVSGGEGQRVRLGRAFGRADVRLAVLDEPFRGLDRGARLRLMAEARRVWGATTLLCVTHDVADTVDFPRVLVVDGGRVVEDGPPRELLKQEESVYRRLMDGAAQSERSWRQKSWRHLWVGDGRLEERGTAVVQAGAGTTGAEGSAADTSAAATLGADTSGADQAGGPP